MNTKIRTFEDGQMMYKDIFDLNWYSTPKNSETGCNTIRRMIPSDRTLPVMFAIGNKDKNGNEVYQGDFDTDGTVVVWCEKCNGWEFGALDIPTNEICIPCHRCDGNFFFEDQISDFEVIGNICQNDIRVNAAK